MSQFKRFQDKTCSACKETKRFFHFSAKTNYCKPCHSEYYKAKGKTLKGVMERIYRNQRTASKKRGMALPDYTLGELKQWILSNDGYALWCQWVWSGYQKDFIPSPDRLDDDKPYTLANLRLVTWKRNRMKFSRGKSKAVKQFKDDVLLQEYASLNLAMRETGVDTSSIRKALSGRCRHAGGFQWELA